jgi:putative Mg2+ transporter-C (MgtC) family protein
MDPLYFPVLLNGIKIFVAILCAVILGLARSDTYQPPAISSLILISVGACLFMIVTVSLNPLVISEPQETAANVMLGMLFLGIIVVLKNKGSLISLVSSASLWVAGAVGLATGTGLFLESILVTGIAYGILRWFCLRHNV